MDTWLDASSELESSLGAEVDALEDYSQPPEEESSKNISTCSMINVINVPKNKDSSYLFQRVFLHLKSWSIYYLSSALPLTHLRHGTGSDKMWHSHYGMLLPRYQTDQTKYKKQVLVLKHISL